MERNCLTILDLERLKSLAQQGSPENSAPHVDERSPIEIAFSRTTTYQIYFLADGRTQGREEFQADDDVAAIRIARVLYDACSDVCEAFELWQETRQIRAAQQPHHATTRLADLIEAHQRVTIDREEAISQSKGMIARSRRLIATLDEIKSRATAAF